MNIIGKRYWFFGLSLAIIIPGIIAMLSGGLKPSIDFTGGTIIEVTFQSGVVPSAQAIQTAISPIILAGSDQPIGTVEVQTVGSTGVSLRMRELNQTTEDTVVSTLEASFGKVTLDLEDNVGAAIGSEVTQRAAGAVALAALGITLYIWFAFRKLPHASRYGISAVIAMIHDLLVLLGVESILGLVLGWQADSLFLTAVLTVIGFSVHDTIVVFDRVRENRTKYRSTNFETVVNHSVVQTLDRSINTTFTVLLTLFAMALFGGVTTQHFIIVLLIGMTSGAYSSIFNAAAILVVWENREWERWFRR